MMQLSAYIYKGMAGRLALIAALVLAAMAVFLMSGSLGSDVGVHAQVDCTNSPFAPTFNDAGGRNVDENTPPGVNIGNPISATDNDEVCLEFGNTLTYKLEGEDAASFDIDSSTGQLITKAPLDTETKASYTVTVAVDDGGTPVTRSVTITVDNVTEAPDAPHPPTVVSGEDEDDGDQDAESTTSLKVVWHPPVNNGPRTISNYAVEFKESTGTAFGNTGVGSVNGTTVDITGLEADTSYDVRVQATNAEGTSPWSFVGTGSTNKEGNSPPVLNDDTPPDTDNSVQRSVAENTSAGENVGSPVTASDGDTTTLTYSLGGPDTDLFNFNTRSGQIRTKSPLNHEDPRCYVENSTTDSNDTSCFYYVTVTVVDGAGGSDAIGVRIAVSDGTEAPSAPARPTARATEKSSTSLDVSWNAPANTGPAITSYEVQYRQGTDPFSNDNCGVTGTDNCLTITGTKVTIVDLEENTTYEVRIKATNAERASAWSGTGNGRTNKANQEPIFDDRPGTGTGSERSTDGSNYTISRTIDENPRSGLSVGRIFADDADNDRLTYKLVESEDTDAARVELSKFTINETTGEIRTKAGETYSYEDLGADTCNPVTDAGTDRCYTVKVEVRDGLNVNRVEDKDEAADDTITLKIGLRDRSEPPAVPTVMVTSPAVNTTLVVTWHARNTGPPITTYDVQYRKGGGSFIDDNCEGTTVDGNCNGLAGTTTTITGLDEDTSYSVQVRARNEEGTSAWSGVETDKTNKGTNPPPTFRDGASVALSVDENKSSTDVGNELVADDDVSDVLTYELGGPDETLFSIVSTSGQIRTRSALNTEAVCSGSDADQTGGHQENCTYTVWVKVDDRAGGSVLTVVTITVNDVDESPVKPGAPRVTATIGTGQSLDVSWTAPRNDGKPPITDYDIQYREVKTGTTQDNWELWPHGTADDPTANSTETSTTITRRLPAPDADPLKPRTQYEVRVRAKNGEPTGDVADNWSPIAKATTGQSNNRPSFDTTDTLIEIRVDENTRAGQNIDNAISASDADSNSLTYSLEGPGKDSFTIVSSSGQIRTRAALNYEERSSYSVTVNVDDRQKKANSVATKSVTIMVDHVREPPPPPAAPTVLGIPGSTSSIRVTWAEPANTGSAVTGYDVHYREVGSGPTRWDHFGADRSTIITGLKAGTRYEVQVRARSGEGTGDWSRWGSGSPNPDVANRNPAFSGGSRSLSVAENTPPNTDVGAPVAATDRDGDTLTYTLEGADADSFDVLSTSDGGQIRTSAALNHEEKASYAVTVRVSDGRGGTDAVNITIRVTDVNTEAPDTPFAPTVTAVSSTSLQVTWDAPANTGPPITDYDYRYREPGGTWTDVTNTTITGTAVTIEGLAASTSYDVEVRATNAEGTSDWSNPGIGATNAPGANNPPVFSDGGSATRTVSANSPAGQSIGDPVTATDADPGVTLVYTLEGRDAALFEIVPGTGQLLTKAGVTLIAGETYTVIVAADDGIDRSRITVSIEATAAPPNNLPAFAQGTSTTRSVTINAPAGTNIGQAFRATDADTDDTVTYSLEGPDGASFAINGSTGQMSTKAGVTLTSRTYNVTVVAADQKGGRGTIAVTVGIDDRDGSVSLSPSLPAFGDTVTASVSDPDGGVTAVTWQWEISTDRTNWSIILGSTSATYSPTTANIGSYLRVTASYTDAVGPGKSAQIVTAAITDDDDGTVTLSTRTPEVGTAVTASLSDPDRPITNIRWQWARSSNGFTWTNISGATLASYTPGRSDAGVFLRATASYDDSVGTGKSAQASTSSVVAQMTLLSAYDINGNGRIERNEAVLAVNDYFDDELSLDDVKTVLSLYFSS